MYVISNHHLQLKRENNFNKCIVCALWKIINLVLYMFNDNLLHASHVFILCSSLFNISLWGELFRLWHNVVSSAMIRHLNNLLAVGKSLRYTRNNKGTKTNPWGTLVLIIAQSDYFLSYTTYCFLSINWCCWHKCYIWEISTRVYSNNYHIYDYLI